MGEKDRCKIPVGRRTDKDGREKSGQAYFRNTPVT